MNKFKKLGLSALCGSLAVTSASAGELQVLGGATATWSSNTGTNGNPIGLSSGITFSGSGELDNGTTFTLTLTNADQSAFSAGSIALTTPTLGSFSIGGITGGNGIGGYDDKMPSAWEETWGTSLGTGIDLAKGVGSSMNVQYSTPRTGGTKLIVAFTPVNGGGMVNDKGVGGDKGNNLGRGVDVLLDMDVPFTNMFVGYSNTKRDGADGAGADTTQDREEGVAGINFTVGPVKVGMQKTLEYTGNEETGTDVMGYANTMFGLSFNVNDNLSVSYGKVESKKAFVSSANGKPKMVIESFQAAYTMGGASVKVAETSADSAAYTMYGADKEATTIALSLAF
jgi:outer membrane protein OmpU